jgi:hypothetical protein
MYVPTCRVHSGKRHNALLKVGEKGGAEDSIVRSERNIDVEKEYTIEAIGVKWMSA